MKTIFTFFIALSCWTYVGAQDFQDSAATMGITTGCGSCGVGCGLSFVDFNNDGWDDLTFATQDTDSILFYQNNGGTGFTKLYSLVDHDEKSEQVLWLDYDNDGDQDLFVTTFQGINRLYENDGSPSMNMTDVTVAAGLPTHSDPSYGAVAGDYNNDGWLDIYVANWSFPPVHKNYLFHNNGDGTFTDMTVPAMVTDDYELTFCSAFLDINNNGLQDLYNSQDRDQSPNTMFKNLGNSTFADISASSGTNIGIDAMDVGVGDFDSDGDLDIYVTNTPTDGGSALFRNNGDETFTNVVADYGVGFLTRVGWGGNFFDCENDGDLDLYVCAMGTVTYKKNALYINQIENDTFVEAFPVNMAGDTVNSFANAMADFNHDGLIDIAVNNADIGPTVNKFHLWENTHSTTYNWIKINLEGVVANRDGVGSWIEVYRGGNKYVRYTHSGIGYLSQNSKTELIGLKDDLIIDSLIVKWLSGNVNKMYNVAANQTLNILENTAPLDVELLSFTANPTDRLSVQLDWATATEENNKGFHLQRSSDGVHFNNIKWIDGKGTTNFEQQYRYEDLKVENNTTYYYRLRQLDFDGSTSFSKIATARLEGDELVVGDFYPNPAHSGFVLLNVSGSNYQTVNLELFDLQGVLIYAQSATGLTETSTLRVPLESSWSGILVARISVGEKVYFRKLIHKAQ